MAPGPTATREEAVELVTRLRADAATAEGHVRSVTGLGHGLPLLPADVVDRPAWAGAALSGMAALTAGAQLPDVGRAARAVTARTAGLQLGGVVAYLGGRVLGQYDPFGGPSGDGRLLLVAPNVHAAQQALDVSSYDFGLWVCLHEATHRLQFTAVPWLRSYFAEEVSRLLSLAGDRPARASTGCRSSSARCEESRGDSLAVVELLQGPEQRAVLDKLLALTTLLEGHADHVMDAVGPEVVPSVETIRARFTIRRTRRRAWSTGCCARCSGWRRRCGSTPTGRRSRSTSSGGGDGRVQHGVETPDTVPTRRGARRPGDWVAPGARPALTPDPALTPVSTVRWRARPTRRAGAAGGRGPRPARARGAAAWSSAARGGADSLALAAAAAVRAPRTGVRAGRDRRPRAAGGFGRRAAATAALLRRARARRCGCTRSTSPGRVGLEAAARRARYAALCDRAPARRQRRSCSATPSTTRPRPCCSASAAAPGPGRSRACAAVGPAAGCARCSGVRRRRPRAACAAQGSRPWDDPHNTDPRFTRVRLRHEVLPLLEDVLGGGVAEALARTADQLREDADALDALAGGSSPAPRPRPGRAAGSADRCARGRHAGWRARLPCGAGCCALAGRPRVCRLTATHLHAADALAAAGPAARASPCRAGLELSAPLAGSASVRTGGHRPGEPSSDTTGGSTPPCTTGDIAATLVTADADPRPRSPSSPARSAPTTRSRKTAAGGRAQGRGHVHDRLRPGAARAGAAGVHGGVSSYGSATTSSGVVRILKDLDRDIAGRARARSSRTSSTPA